MRRKHSGFTLTLVVLTFGALSAFAQNVAPPSDFIQGSKVMTGTGILLHTTLREDCRSIVFDAHGRIWTVGIQSDGSEELNATRQFLSVGLFDGAHWSQSSAIDQSAGPELRSAIVVEPDGQPLTVYESGEDHRFALKAAKYTGGRWVGETLSTTDYKFRPVLAVDHQGKT